MLGLSKKEIHRKFDEIVKFAELEDFIDAPVKNTKYVLTASAGDETVFATRQVIVEAPALGRR